jgi:hypothetical protein
MIPYELDPSLHTAEPESEVLDDGFSPPQHAEPGTTMATAPTTDPEDAVPDEAFSGKSPF